MWRGPFVGEGGTRIVFERRRVYLERVVVKFTKKFVEYFQEADWSIAFWL